MLIPDLLFLLWLFRVAASAANDVGQAFAWSGNWFAGTYRDVCSLTSTG